MLAVTHLAQVASSADHHGVVSKSQTTAQGEANTGVPYSQIDIVTGKARMLEVARMLGGDVQSDAALKHAQEMLRSA